MRIAGNRVSFYDLFDRLAATTVATCAELRSMFDAFDRLEERQARIGELEHECDVIAQDLFRETHAGMITPIDKEDIAALVGRMDDIVDAAEGAAVRVVLFRITECRPEAQQMAEYLLRAVELLQGAISHLRYPRRSDAIPTACAEVYHLERECDTAFRKALAGLFESPGIDPLLLMKWQDVFDRIENAMNHCDDVAEVLEAIHVKHG